MARANTKPGARPPQGVRPAGGAAPAAVTPPAPTEGTRPGDALRLVAIPPEGFRRCGRRWSGTEPTDVPVADLTDDEIERLLAEPQLAVTLITQDQE